MINYLKEVREDGGFYINRRPAEIFEGHYSPETHPQVKVFHPEGTYTLVDEGMADVVAGLWSIGVDTSFSCQGPEQRYLVVRRSHRFRARDYLEDAGEIVVEDRPGGCMNIGSWYFGMEA